MSACRGDGPPGVLDVACAECRDLLIERADEQAAWESQIAHAGRLARRATWMLLGVTFAMAPIALLNMGRPLASMALVLGLVNCLVTNLVISHARRRADDLRMAQAQSLFDLTREAEHLLRDH